MKSKKQSSSSRVGGVVTTLLAAVIALFATRPAHGAIYYWDTVTAGPWATGANWSDDAASGGVTGVVPLATDSVVFNQSSVNGAVSVTLPNPCGIAGMTFNNTGTTAFSGSSTITLGAGGLTINSGAGDVSFSSSSPFTLGAAQTWANNTATAATISGAINNGSFPLTIGGSTGAFTLSQVVYGTGMVHSAILGRRFNWPTINLGFAGEGKMEPELADLLAELDPAVYVLDCLPNMEPPDVAQRVEPFVKRLRQAHPLTPILLVEDRVYANAFLTPVRAARHAGNHETLQKTYRQLKKSGVKNLYYLCGDTLFGSDGEGSVDGSHPSDLGFMRQADQFAEALGPLLKAHTSR